LDQHYQGYFIFDVTPELVFNQC